METIQTHNKLDFEIEPMTRIFPKSTSDLDILNLKRSLGRQASLSELHTVKDGTRDCSTLTCSISQISDELKTLAELDLVYLPRHLCGTVEGFAHKFYDAENLENTSIYGYVARNYDDAREFRDAEIGSDEIDNDKIGDLLGYPQCCREHFQKVWPYEFDPIFSAAMNTEGAEIKDNGRTVILDGIDPRVNPMLRYFGLKITPQLPCSFSCEESKEFGDAFLKYFDDKKLIKKILSAPMTWSCFGGVAQIETPWFVGISDSVPFEKKHEVIVK